MQQMYNSGTFQGGIHGASAFSSLSRGRNLPRSAKKETGGAGLSRRSDLKLVHLLLLSRARGTLVGAVNREGLQRRAEVEFGVLSFRV